jgi:hypothetical protein
MGHRECEFYMVGPHTVTGTYYDQRSYGPHGGRDLAAPEGTPIRCPVNGSVIQVGSKPEREGNYLMLKDDAGVVWYFGHLQHYPQWAVGNKITQGQRIGLLGKTGQATGPHLHYETRPGGTHKDPVEVLRNWTAGGDNKPPTQTRLFRIATDSLNARDQTNTNCGCPGSYKEGEIVPCNLIERGQEVKPGEGAWGRIAGGRFAGKWVYLGYTKEVKPGHDAIRYFVVFSDELNVRAAPQRDAEKRGAYERGAVVPISEVVSGEPVKPGEDKWGKVACGPHKNRYVYLGYTSEIK